MIKTLLFTLWIIGLFILSFTIVKIFNQTSDLSKYLTSAGILISAFIASTTVLLSIQNTKNLEKEKEKKDEQKNLAYLSQICNTIYMEIDKNKMIWPRNNIKEDKKLFPAYYEANENIMISHLTATKDIFESLILKLNDKDLYLYQPILSSLESLNKLLYEFNSISNRLSFEYKDKDDDKHHTHFFNGMQIVHMLSKGIEETLTELNSYLIKKIPNIQSKSILNTSLTLLNDDNLDLPFFDRAKHMFNSQKTL